MADSRNRHDGDIVVSAVLFLFFFQLISEFVEGIYAFGLAGTSIPPEIVSIVLLVSPVVLVFWPRQMKQRAFRVLIVIIVLSRLVAVMLDTRGRMLLSGVGVAASLIWLPALVWRSSHEDASDAQHHLSLGVIMAVLLSILFRVLGSGFDISMRGSTQLLGWLLAAAMIFFVVRRPQNQASIHAPRSQHPVSFGRLVLLALGITSALILIYFMLGSPNVVARWTGVGYPAIITALALGMAILATVVMRPSHMTKIRSSMLWTLNALFILALVATLCPHQIRFPPDASGYPLYASDVSFIQEIPLVLMLLLCPVVLLDVALYIQTAVHARPTLRALGGAFSISSLYLLLMIFAHVFTTVYDYIPVVGPAFRDRFWLVHLASGLGLVLPLITLRSTLLSWKPAPMWGRTMMLLSVLSVGAVFVTMARPEAPAPKTALTALTYNIQQGYDAEGQKNADGQLALMRAADADIIGLQESDTNRIAGGNADLVRYFAEALDMHSYYGPTTVAGTFGIALLSKVPIENPRTFYMFSEGEQTAAIEAQITIDGTTYNVFVTHLGNGGPIVQQEAVLEIVAGKDNVVLMGDFNFRPDSEQYRLTSSVLDDAWLRRWPDGVDDAGAQPARRIDHFFISPALGVEDVRYIDSPASDHPAVLGVFTP